MCHTEMTHPAHHLWQCPSSQWHQSHLSTGACPDRSNRNHRLLPAWHCCREVGTRTRHLWAPWHGTAQGKTSLSLMVKAEESHGMGSTWPTLLRPSKEVFRIEFLLQLRGPCWWQASFWTELILALSPFIDLEVFESGPPKPGSFSLEIHNRTDFSRRFPASHLPDLVPRKCTAIRVCGRALGPVHIPLALPGQRVALQVYSVLPPFLSPVPEPVFSWAGHGSSSHVW